MRGHTSNNIQPKMDDSMNIDNFAGYLWFCVVWASPFLPDSAIVLKEPVASGNKI